MKFTPKTEQQLAEENLLTPGWYDFVVLEAKSKISKAAAGRGETEPNMIELKLRVYETPDRGVFVTDYLMEEMAFKLRHFCAEVGLLAAYDNGHLTPEACVGKEGRVKIGPSKARGDFKPKDEAKDYGEPKNAPRANPAPTAKASKVEDDDEVPY